MGDYYWRYCTTPKYGTDPKSCSVATFWPWKSACVPCGFRMPGDDSVDAWPSFEWGKMSIC